MVVSSSTKNMSGLLDSSNIEDNLLDQIQDCENQELRNG